MLSSSEHDSDTGEESWVQWWCSLQVGLFLWPCYFAIWLLFNAYFAQGNEFLCEVSEDFIRDEFNLYGLSLQVPFYSRAISIIIGEDSESAASCVTGGATPDREDAAESALQFAQRVRACDTFCR